MSFVCYHKPNKRHTSCSQCLMCTSRVCKAKWEKATRESNLTVLRQLYSAQCRKTGFTNQVLGNSEKQKNARYYTHRYKSNVNPHKMHASTQHAAFIPGFDSSFPMLLCYNMLVHWLGVTLMPKVNISKEFFCPILSLSPLPNFTLSYQNGIRKTNNCIKQC